jgi:hypothetical protein
MTPAGQSEPGDSRAEHGRFHEAQSGSDPVGCENVIHGKRVIVKM